MATVWKYYWGLVLVTLGFYATILLWSLPKVAASAGGLVPFDLRPAGYSVASANEFLAAISEEGRRFYLGPQHQLDAIFPLLMGCSLGFGLFGLLKGKARSLRFMALALPFVAASADTMENQAVKAMLLAAPVTDEMILSANQWTLLKSGATTLSILWLTLLLLSRLSVRLRQRGCP